MRLMPPIKRTLMHSYRHLSHRSDRAHLPVAYRALNRGHPVLPDAQDRTLQHLPLYLDILYQDSLLMEGLFERLAKSFKRDVIVLA